MVAPQFWPRVGLEWVPSGSEWVPSGMVARGFVATQRLLAAAKTQRSNHQTTILARVK